MTLETLREELIKDIIEVLDGSGHVAIQSRQSVHSLVTQIIVDSFDEYECENKIGVYDGNLFEKAKAKKLEKANVKKPGGCICTRRAKAN
jgi:hypothetical protein